MGNLPTHRIAQSKPFDVAGVDYAGPIKIHLAKTRGYVTQKGYIALFVFFSTHAIHIEVVEDYSSASFICTFHRFTARQGRIVHLPSDQGITFVGAEPVLRQMLHGSSDWANCAQTEPVKLGTE